MQPPPPRETRIIGHDVALALETLRHAEHHSGVVPDAELRTMTVRGWEARDHGDLSAPTDWHTTLPVDHSRPLPDAQAHTSTRLSAPLVRFSKFSTHGGVRLRSFYPHAAEPLTMKLLIAEPDAHGALRSEVDARRQLSALPQFPVLPITADGFTDSYAYFVEPIVTGNHAATDADKVRMADETITMVLAAHRSLGVTDERIVWNAKSLDRLKRLLRWAGHPSPRHLLRRAKRVVEATGTYATGWCHGDLVPSNIIVDDGGAVQLVDWEFAHRGPVAADLAKLIASTNAGVTLAGVLESRATPDDIGPMPGRLPVRLQLAGVLLRELSWWEGKRARAEAAGRTAPFGRWVDRRVALVSALLSDDPLG